VLSHTFWFLPSVASVMPCAASEAEAERFYHDHTVILAAGAPQASGLRHTARVGVWTIVKTKTIRVMRKN